MKIEECYGNGYNQTVFLNLSCDNQTTWFCGNLTYEQAKELRRSLKDALVEAKHG